MNANNFASYRSFWSAFWQAKNNRENNPAAWAMFQAAQAASHSRQPCPNWAQCQAAMANHKNLKDCYRFMQAR